MTDACAGLDDGDAGVLPHELDEAAAAARNDEVDVAFGVEQFGCSFAGSWQQFDHVRIDAEAFEHLVYHAHDGAVGAVGVAATLQDAGVSALQAQGADVEADVGPCFVDDADDTEWHADAAQPEAVGQYVLLEHTTQRRRQRGYLARVGGNVGQAFGSQFQAVVLGIVRVHALQVLAVFL